MKNFDFKSKFFSETFELDFQQQNRVQSFEFARKNENVELKIVKFVKETCFLTPQKQKNACGKLWRTQVRKKSGNQENFDFNSKFLQFWNSKNFDFSNSKNFELQLEKINFDLPNEKKA